MQPANKLLVLAAILVIAAGLGSWWLLGQSSPPPVSGQNLAQAMGPSADADEFARVTGPAPLDFPADHGAHPDYGTEWWYFTGNLRTEQGEDFGFQLTLFRSALAPKTAPRASDWASRQVWMGHFAITDINGQTHRASERYQRGALGLAGATTGPVRVWLDDWQIKSEREQTLFPLTINADDPSNAMALSLRLTADKPHVLQGDKGYSQKGANPANASRYYSYTRLSASGDLAWDERRLTVTGSAWLDREWSTSALDANQQGWDWFALQLEDGRDIMVYRLRRNNGDTDPNSAGIVVSRAGEGRVLSADEFQLTPTRYWQSPQTSSRYPVAWTIRLTDSQTTLQVEARVDAQEMPTTIRYWEGAVRVSGDAIGLGYLEMTGY